MVKIILASESPIKENTLKQWFKENKKCSVSIKKISIEDNLLPPQPLNTGGSLTCSDRLKNTLNKCDNLIKYDYVVSIENSIVIEESKLIDVVDIKIKDVLMNKEYSATGGRIDVTYKLLNGYSKLPLIIEELQESYEKTSKNYIFDGCEKTFGELINKYYPNIQSNNWMKTVCGVDRKSQIMSVLDELSLKINV